MMAIPAQNARLRSRIEVETSLAWQENRGRQDACQCKPRRRDQVFDFAVTKSINLRDGPNPLSLIQFAQDGANFHRFTCLHSATVEDIIKKIDRARAKVEQIKPGSILQKGKKKVALL